jgi:hypothetical protein
MSFRMNYLFTVGVNLAIAAVLAGCSGPTESRAVESGAAGSTQSLGSAEDAETGGKATSSSVAGALGKCTDGTAIPTQSASVQTVTFTLRTTSSATRYIATAGAQCSTFAIGRAAALDWEQLTLDVASISCNGRCAMCNCDSSKPLPREVIALEPGTTYSFDWDARSYVVCSTPIAACPEQTQLFGEKQPAPPGRYKLWVPMAVTLPPECAAADTVGSFTCRPSGMTSCSWSQPMCKMESQTSIEFTLPESGNIQVEVPLS